MGDPFAQPDLHAVCSDRRSSLPTDH